MPLAEASPAIRRTPVVPFAGPAASPIWLKDETSQVTGAFKFRGVIAKLSTLPPGALVVAASTGNHGLGVAHASQLLGMRAIVFVPRSTPEVKRCGIADHGAALQLVDGDYDAAEREARRHAASAGAVFVSSFDDLDIINGHRSMLRELDDEPRAFDCVFAPVGGGGLVAACLLHWGPATRVIGVEDEQFPAMQLSLAQGERVRLPAVHGRAEGLLVRQVGEIAFEVCAARKLQVMTVSIAEMEEAVVLLWRHHGIRAEAAGAASLAAARKAAVVGQRSVAIVSGGNIDEAYFQAVLARSDTRA